ncbi:MAG TPA: GNAT family N-acetyltransferase [Bryobacteraceae bacterium]|jgi:ribosomal protein S18 acetylase RimI-like enzyme|nr:GNAT family N-acetyltransferase [Bryobacteraceae bacterium]
MAARIEAAPHCRLPDLVDLRHLRSLDLEPLLAEEIRNWRDCLDWDFSKSAELVRRFLDMRALHGSALIENREVIGYAYHVQEDYKGLIGDLYVRRKARTPELELRLLDASVNQLIQSPGIRRIESQLMMAEPRPGHLLPVADHGCSFERNFMLLELGLHHPPGPSAVRYPIFVERWSDQYQEQAAQLIAAAYEGHVDSRINDQYCSLPGARRFLFNVVQYPGCGAFFQPASFAAFDAQTGRMCGMCLASIVSPDCGHITQICVAPWVRAKGIGYELLRQAMAALDTSRCRRVSLTVTASNQGAVKLYESIGFRTIRKFSAQVWEGF